MNEILDDAATAARPRSRYELYRQDDPGVSKSWTLEILSPPSRMYSANGIKWGPDDRLYVGEVWGEQVTAWDPDKDELSIASAMGTPIKAPDDVAFDSTGAIYASEPLNGRVSGRRADGEYVTFVEDSPMANGITVDPRTDYLYVAEMNEDGRVLRVDTEVPGRYEVIAEGLSCGNACEVGASGELFTPQVFSGDVVAVDLETGAVRTVASGFEVATAVKFSPDGRLCVAEAGAGQITAVDLESGSREVLVRQERGIDNFCWDRQGRLYISNFSDGSLHQFAADGQITKSLSGPQLLGPYQIARATDGSLIVADANSVVRVDRSGHQSRVRRLLVDLGFIIVGIAMAGERLFALSITGDLFTWSDAGAFELVNPGLGVITAIAGDGDRCLVAGPDGVVLGLDGGGEVVSEISTGLGYVSALARADGVLAACDEKAGEGVVIEGDRRATIRDLVEPQAVVVTSDSVFFAETGARLVSRYSTALDGREVVCEGVPIGFPVEGIPSHRRCCLAADPDGSVYLGCDGDGSIRILQRSN